MRLPLLFLFVLTALARGDEVPLSWGPHKDLTAKPAAGGGVEITLGAGNPHFWTGVVPEAFDPERHRVFEMQAFAPEGAASVALRFRAEDGSMAVAGASPLALSEAWQPWAMDWSRANTKPAAGDPQMRFHVTLQGKPGSVLRLRGFKLREPSTEEIRLQTEREQMKQARESDAKNILSYLQTDWPASVDTVHVGFNELTLTGKSPRPARLVGLPPEMPSHLAKVDGGQPVPLNEEGRFRIVIPRVDEVSKRDRASWRWRLADADSGEWVSAAKWPTAEGPALGGNLPRMTAPSAKGLGGVGSIARADHEIYELGIRHVTMNVVLGSLLRDTPAKGHAPWVCEGRTYYYNEAATSARDTTLRHHAANGVIVSAILLVPNHRDSAGEPVSMLTHPEAEARGIYAMPNLTAQEPARRYAAAVRFLAERHNGAGDAGRISNWILHNEIDQAGTWTNMGDQPLARYLEAYHRSARLVYHTARLFDRHARVFVSLTHHWTKQSAGTGTYVVRDLLELFAQMAKAEGDFEWGVAYHPYPRDLRNPDTWNDKDVTADFDTPYITPKNLEVLPAFLRQERFLYRGKPRGILLSEQGFNTPTLSLDDQKRQAAGLVYVFRKLRDLPEIEAYHLHRLQDMPEGEGGLRLGILSETGERKLGWEVYREIGTGSEKEREFGQLADEVMAARAAP